MSNPLIQPWPGPFGGVPPFDKVRVDHFKPGLEAAMAEMLREIDAIANDPAPPTFENTLAAMERSGKTFDRAATIYYIYSSTLQTPGFQEVEREMEPKLAAFFDKIIQNERLFPRLEAVYQGREKSGLTPEQQRLAWLKYSEFARSGAKLDAAAKKRLGGINERLAALYTDFSQNVLADESTSIPLDKEEDFAGLPAMFRSARKVLNTRSSVEPFLTYSDRRDLREKVWRAFASRGDNGDTHDNKKVIAEIVKLRDERAKLLGYRTHAHWRLEMSMAKTPERAAELLEAFWKPAVARAKEEVADMQAAANRLGHRITIEPWDYRYYAEKVRKEKYDLDDNEVMAYLELENLREGMFWVAGELLGLRFTPITNVPVYHPDVRAWEVKNDDGKHVALFYFDPYAREHKRSGAWMNSYRSQERFSGEITTIVSNNSNFMKPAAGEPVLVSWGDATTLFHEFGHALHGLSSSVSYPSLAGTNVDRDYVEFPSQLLESWLSTPEVLNRFARHYKTGAPIPKDLVARIEKASKFNKGFDNVEYLSSALVDLKLHLEPEKAADIAAFEAQTLEAIGMPREIAMRHRLPHFGHLFSGDSYSAGYYSYLWADTLSADAYEAFVEAKGPYDKQVAKRLHQYVFSAGNTVDPGDAYRSFRGRDAKIDALMRKRGFGSTAASPPAAS
jgi:peptidyl-dipeptidase Dcp